MPEPQAVLIPLLNPNEPEAQLAAVHVKAGQQVAAGDLLCTLETTKSTAEVEAESAGFVTGLRLSAGQTVRAGEILCYLADTADAAVPEPIPAARPGSVAGSPASTAPEGLRISQRALALAQAENLDLNQFDPAVFITEGMVQAALQQRASQPNALDTLFQLPLAPFDPRAMIVYGGGGHGKAVIELIRRLGAYQVVGVVDDGLPPGATVMGVPVLGGADILPELAGRGIRLAANAVGAIGNIAIRIKIFQRLGEAGFACPALIHPSAVIEASAVIGAGVHIFPLAYVGSDCRLDFGCIINTGAIISHDCHIETYANISPGAILAGQVHVGPGALVGMGANINLLVNIGRQARLGNGSIIKSDVPDKGIVRAGGVWPNPA